MVFSALGTGPAFFYFLFSPRPTEAGEALTPPPLLKDITTVRVFPRFSTSGTLHLFFSLFCSFQSAALSDLTHSHSHSRAENGKFIEHSPELKTF